MNEVVNRCCPSCDTLRSRLQEAEQEAKRQARMAAGCQGDYAKSNRKREELERVIDAMTDLLTEIKDEVLATGNHSILSTDTVRKIMAALKAEADIGSPANDQQVTADLFNQDQIDSDEEKAVFGS